MSTTSLRGLAVTVAAVIAVLTGIATGLLGSQQTCTTGASTGQQAPPAATTAANPATTDGNTAGGGIGAAEPGGKTPTGNAPQAPPQQPSQAAPPTCTDDFGWSAAAAGFAGAAFVGGVLLLLMIMASGRGAQQRGGRPQPHHTGDISGIMAGARAESDRAALIQAAIYVRDRVTSRALADRLGQGLHEAGVDTIEPAGARFDPAHHEAGGATPSDDPGLVGSIAAVEVPGYADRNGRVLRAPVVTVYQNSRSPQTGQHTGPQQQVRRTRGEQR
jgi:hypothetical protein